MNNSKLIYSILGIVIIVLIWTFGSVFLPEKIPTISVVFASIKVDFINVHLPNILITAKIAMIGLLLALIISFSIVFIINN